MEKSERNRVAVSVTDRVDRCARELHYRRTFTYGKAERRVMMTEYLPLERYGLVGNLETCALVGADGSIDWCPLPHLESTSVFARLLDAESGGHFAVRPAAAFDSNQRYHERTNVLQTTFHTALGELSVVDFMPVVDDVNNAEQADRIDSWSPGCTIYRKVTCERGQVDLEVMFAPRFDYARTKTTVEPAADGVRATSGEEALCLSSSLSYETSDSDIAHATRSLEAGETEWFVLRYGTEVENGGDGESGGDGEIPPEGDPADVLDRTIAYWRGWPTPVTIRSACSPARGTTWWFARGSCSSC